MSKITMRMSDCKEILHPDIGWTHEFNYELHVPAQLPPGEFYQVNVLFEAAGHGEADFDVHRAIRKGEFNTLTYTDDPEILIETPIGLLTAHQIAVAMFMSGSSPNEVGETTEVTEQILKEAQDCYFIENAKDPNWP